MPGFGLIPWGTGYWGLAVSPTPVPVPPTSSNIHIINVIPAPGSFNISRNQTFTFTIKSELANGNPGFAVNPNSVFIALDNQIAVQGLTVNPNFAAFATLNSDGVSLDFQITPNYLFKDADVFTLQVYATDIYGNPSFPFWAGYVVADTRPSLITPIFPLDGYVDVPNELSLHFLINQLAAPDVGLDPGTLNVFVNGQQAVINSVIQDPFLGVYSTINFPAPNDVVSPFELVLDSTDRYEKGEIVTVSATAVSTIIPVLDASAVFLNTYGQPAVDAYNTQLPSFSVTQVQKLSNKLYQLNLSFGIAPSLFGEGPFGLIAFGAGYQNLIENNFILVGFKIKNSNGNVFSIVEIVDFTKVIVEAIPKTLTGSYSFITASSSDLVTPVFAGYFQGVYLVDNLGDGYHVNVTWHPARTTRPDYDLAYLIYYSTTRSDVFFEEPKLITQGRRLPPPETIQGADAQLFGYFAQIPLPVGVSYYFGVRATEYPHDPNFIIVPPDGYGSFANGRTVVDGYSFAIPAAQVLMTTTVGSGTITIRVPSTAGYARAGGYITVGPEIMRYASLTGTTFTIMSTGRGQFGTTIQNIHSSGELVRMYYGNKDDNTVIAKNLVSWESPNDPHRTRPDLITTDFTLEDGYHAGFEFFDYCGYHRFRPDELFNDTDQCGTYVGGEYNGHRGLFIYDRVLANEEQLLEVDGEPAILLRRLWSGERCICMTSRKDSSKVRSCALCFGTGYKGGFVQYNNPRRSDKRIMVHFAPADEDVGMGQQAGWEQKFRPGSWTLSVPAVKDRDVIVRFDEFGDMDWVYVVNTVSRAKLMFGRYARQKLTMSRLDKTDVMYQFKLVK